MSDTVDLAQGALEGRLLRLRLRESLCGLQRDVAEYQRRRERTIEDAPDMDSAAEGARVWDILIGERAYAIGLLSGLLEGRQRAQRDLAPESESELRAAFGDR